MTAEGLLYVLTKDSRGKGISSPGAVPTFKSKDVHVVIGIASECKAPRNKRRAKIGSVETTRAMF